MLLRKSHVHMLCRGSTFWLHPVYHRPPSKCLCKVSACTQHAGTGAKHAGRSTHTRPLQASHRPCILRSLGGGWRRSIALSANASEMIAATLMFASSINSSTSLFASLWTARINHNNICPLRTCLPGKLNNAKLQSTSVQLFRMILNDKPRHSVLLLVSWHSLSLTHGTPVPLCMPLSAARGPSNHFPLFLQCD